MNAGNAVKAATVYRSDNPLVTELKTHAPEVFQDEKQDWFISSVQYPVRGVSVARLDWR